MSGVQAAHPALQPSTALQSFLEASEEDFTLEVSRAAHEANGGAKKKLASTLQLFRDLGTSTANLVSGRSTDEEEDPEYLKARQQRDMCKSQYWPRDHTAPQHSK